MRRRVLLLEPNYRNKYPPMGLMKLAMYHRLQGDDVVFYKGDLKKFILAEVTRDAVGRLLALDPDYDWRLLSEEIAVYLKTGRIPVGSELEREVRRPFIGKDLADFYKYFRENIYLTKPRWDRVCVTTLFTFHWKITVETILFAKKISKEVLVGGILASILPRELEAVTGVKAHVGCLHVKNLPGDPSLTTDIEELPLDYSILDEIDYCYPDGDAYYAYATRGCVNKCAFCAVPVLEPEYIDHIPLTPRLEEIKERFGAQRNLLMLDNNVFASEQFETIIDEISAAGFGKNATFIPTNQLDVTIAQLQSGWNDRAAIRKAIRLLNDFTKKLKGDHYRHVYDLLLNNGLLHDYTASKEKVVSAYEEVREIYEKMRMKKPLARYVDFNQGLDGRLATDANMKKLAEINIRPLRIAFDGWALRESYTRAILLAKKYGIYDTSNYLLYNFLDRPIDLYRRLRLGVELSDILKIDVYAFPMKYHPIADKEYFDNREYLGKYWTRKSIRTVQAVLNSTHGKIGRGRRFFFAAFGRSEEEFDELIQMPEAFIIKRWDSELNPELTPAWREAYRALSFYDKKIVDDIVAEQKFRREEWKDLPKLLVDVLNFHLIDRDEIPIVDRERKRKWVEEDFPQTCPQETWEECSRLLEKLSLN